MLQFEFVIYPEGCTVETRENHRLASDAAARSKAGRLAKKHGGPVDLARAGAGEWDARYLTTAAPSEYHAASYRFERLT